MPKYLTWISLRPGNELSTDRYWSRVPVVADHWSNPQKVKNRVKTLNLQM